MKVWKNLISLVIPKERREGVNQTVRKICDSKLYYAWKASGWLMMPSTSADWSWRCIDRNNRASRLKSSPIGSSYTSKISPPILPSFSPFPPTLCLIAVFCGAHYFLLTTGAPVGPRGVTGLPPEFMPWYWYLAFFSLGFRIWNDGPLVEILHHLVTLGC